MLIFFTYLDSIKYNKWFSQFFLIFFCVILILFAGLRDGTVVGTDSPAYYANYIYNFWETEPGYKYLNKFFSSNDLPYNFFLLFLNTISLILMGKFFKINGIFYILPILIYFSDLFLYFNISGIRQAMALSFTSFSVCFAYNKNLKFFLLCMALAAMFHFSSLIFLFAYLIPHSTFKFKHILILIVLSVVTVIVANYMSSNFEYLTKKTDYYTKYQEKAGNIQMLYLVGIAKRSIIFLLSFYYKKYLFNNEKFIYFFNLYLIGFLIFVATYLISPDFGVRFSVYYTMMECILASLMLYFVKSSTRRIVIVTVFALISIYKLIGYMDNDFYTYKSIIDNLI